MQRLSLRAELANANSPSEMSSSVTGMIDAIPDTYLRCHLVPNRLGVLGSSASRGPSAKYVLGLVSRMKRLGTRP